MKATAAEDPGVVLNISEEIDGGYVSRASVQRIYEQIVEDLKNAAEHLKGIEQATIYRVNEKAARVLLSRVYLYMGEWQAAIDECDKVIASGCPLWDLNEWNMTEVKSETRSDNLNKICLLYTSKANAYSVIYDCRLSDSAALAAVNTVRRTPAVSYTHLGMEFRQVERFSQIIVGSQVQTGHFVLDGIFCRNDDHAFPFTQFLQFFQYR